ncbi:NUDIX domain-containing protein [Paenibacillus mesophilus]|uniref:NUDIX hydrolase n=1 Tax=Paenibacillus mesophilus TaxID=2582849 RepID=UPI00110E39AA|nr:NUDIX domain-containing protein [Paenibacillus mesophilus]TMV51471.1 NUDIX domain-containing protein [Paenibacillus mesophilus]
MSMKGKIYEPGQKWEGELEYVSIFPRKDGKWLVSRHAERDTWEFAGGRIESGETPEEAAHRELFEETGTLRCKLTPLSVYSVIHDDRPESFGMLYYAEIEEIGPLPPYEIAEVEWVEEIPSRLTYPSIYPPLIAKVLEYLK